MSEKVKNKNKIVIINKFKDNSTENIVSTLSKVFEVFCNMQIAKK